LGFKEKFDPLNIAKVLTGGSNLAPAMLGRLLGRKTSDIRYFTGKKEYTPRSESSYYNNYTTPSMSGGSQKATRVLQKMLSFMEKSRTDDMQEQDTLDSFNELNEKMREDRHKEVVNVFKEAIKNKRKAMKHMAKEAKKRQTQDGTPVSSAPPTKPSAPTTAPTKPSAPTTAPAKDVADSAAKAAADKVAKETADRAAKAAADKVAKETADRAAKAAADKVAKETADRAAKEAADKAAKAAADGAKKAKDAADAAATAKKAKDAADAAATAKKAKDAAEAKRIKDAADAKRAADTAKKQESVPPAQPSASKVITGAATVTAVLAGREALASNISKYESGEKGYNAYNRGDFWLAKRETEGAYLRKNDIDFSKMTITEYLKRTNKNLKAGGLLEPSDPNVLFAVGKYQLIPGTMKVMAEKLGLDPDKTYLNKDTQDMLFVKGLTTKGSGGRFAVDDYINGKEGATRDAAILALAMEFASVGVPYDIKAKSLFKNTLPKVDLKRGETFYKTPGGFNKAHNPPEAVGAALDADRASKTKLVTNNNTVGSSLNDSSVNNADIKKDMSQGSSAGGTVIIQNNNTTQAKNVTHRSAPQEQLNPTMR
jgi:chemotaxis protein histidine kinase CheA